LCANVGTVVEAKTPTATTRTQSAAARIGAYYYERSLVLLAAVVQFRLVRQFECEIADRA
jgi:hypothetical protein